MSRGAGTYFFYSKEKWYLIRHLTIQLSENRLIIKRATWQSGKR
jgi:hypothetical protein